MYQPAVLSVRFCSGQICQITWPGKTQRLGELRLTRMSFLSFQ